MSAGLPYIPNAAPEPRDAMLAAIGLDDVAQLHSAIPERLRAPSPLGLPAPLATEQELRRHVEELLATDDAARPTLSFLGGSCWPHAVPAVCDEIAQRSEFLTSYFGQVYADHGKLQAFFEYASLVGELVELDVVGQPTYDWAGAAATAVRMAARLTGGRRVLVAGAVDPQRVAVLRTYCEPAVRVELVALDARTGLADLDELERRCGEGDLAAVYLEVPSYLGTLEPDPARACAAAHAHGGLAVVGVDPISLGVLAAPPRYGADLVCGELQPLGGHPQAGGGLAGFVAMPDDPRVIEQFPGLLIGITGTLVAGEHGFGYVRHDRTLYHRRERAPEFIGTATGLSAIVAAAYLSLVGPDGLRDIGVAIVRRTRQLRALVDAIDGARARFPTPAFKQLTVAIDPRVARVEEVDAALRAAGVHGGHPLGHEQPQLADCALWCVTERHTEADVRRGAGALASALGDLRPAGAVTS